MLRALWDKRFPWGALLLFKNKFKVKYTEAELEVIAFAAEDVITTSCTGDCVAVGEPE